MRFALVGNPNCGKTTLFNVLTGSTAHVANWPGVTFDRREGVYKGADERVTIVDLPGIYSLSPYSPEEVVSRNFIIDENPDLIVNIVDATNLERNLYLTTQLLETDLPIIVALNMMDIVKKNNIKIDMEMLSKKLGVPVVAISALQGDGAKDLMTKAVAAAKNKRTATSVLSDSHLDEAYKGVLKMMQDKEVAHPVFHGVKLLEGDSLERGMHPELQGAVKSLRDAVQLDECFNQDFEAAIADARYKYIEKEYAKAIQKPAISAFTKRTEKIDKLLTHKLLGIPMFMLFMFIVFHLTFTEDLLFLSGVFGILEEGIPSPGVYLLGLTEFLVGLISDLATSGLEALGAADWVHGLIVDGVLAGMGAVLSFLPQILMLFLFLSIMEDTGYMSRAAFLMDRLLQKFGLSGKAFMPLLMGFGCSVPAMMGTRTLQNEKERKLTIMLMPFFSCGAKLPIWAMFSAAVFPGRADLVVFCVYFIGIITAGIVAVILDKTVLKGPVAPFILELPAYHIPRLRSLLLHLWEKLKDFVFRATTLIAGATVIIWFLSNFDFTFHMVEANSQESILGIIGTFIRPIFIPLGFASGPDGWKNVVAIVTGLIAKEMVVSTMGVLYTGAEGDALEDETAGTLLGTALAAAFSPVAALAFMAFNLLSVPCMAAVATANAEMRKGKWTWFTIGLWLGTAWIVSFLINIVGSLFV